MITPYLCQCPLGLLPHFYGDPRKSPWRCNGCQCPLGLLPHFYYHVPEDNNLFGSVSMPSRAVTSFLLDTVSTYEKNKYGVSMPSRAVTSFLLVCIADRYWNSGMGVNALSGCYLISTCMYVKSTAQITSVSMPSRAVTSFLQPSPSFVINKISTVSMPSRAVTSFLHGGDWFCSHSTYCVSMPSRAVTSFLRLLLILLLG